MSNDGVLLEHAKDQLAAVGKLAVPELYCPFEVAVHPDAAAVQEASVTWALDVGLIDLWHMPRLREGKIGWLAARAFPTARRVPLQLAADWTTFFCLLDDRTEKFHRPNELRSYLAGLLDVFHDRPSRRDALGQALDHLRRRMVQCATPEWVAGFGTRLGHLFEAFGAEADNRSKQRIPPFAEYLPLRRVTVGLLLEFEFGELTDGIRVPTQVRADPVFQRLVVQACNIVGWANDTYTYEKEILDDEVHNLVLVAMRDLALPLTAALESASRLHNDETRAFELQLENLPSFGSVADAQFKQYTAMLISWVRGHLDWAHETGRYVTVDGNPPSSRRWHPSMVLGS